MKKIVYFISMICIFLFIGCQNNEIKHKIITKCENGVISVVDEASFGEVITVEGLADEGYHLIDTMRYNGIEFIDSFTMPNNDVIIEADFVKNKYNIAIDTLLGGNIIVGENSSEEGKIIEVEVKAKKEYKYVEGSLKYTTTSLENNYEKKINDLIFLMPQADIIISCVFEEKEIYQYNEYLNVSYGPSNKQVFDLYLPLDKDIKGMFVFIHGGFWAMGDVSLFTDESIYLAEECNIAVANIDYRLAGQNESITFDDILDDITASLNKIKEFSIEKGYNIQNVAFGGHSAGGHLSLLYAYMNKNNPFNTMFCFTAAGPTDFSDKKYEKLFVSTDIVKIMTELLDADTIEEALEVSSLYSPITYINNETVPTIMAYGSLDLLVPKSNAETLRKLLEEYNIEYDYVDFKLSGHLLSEDNDDAYKVRDLLLKYIDKYLK